MSPINKLFIRIPKQMSSTYVFDIINEMDVCRVNEVFIRPMKKLPYNIAYAYVDNWGEDSKEVCHALNCGNAMCIPSCNGSDLKAYKFVDIRLFTK
jgi:hypothetical protein